MYFVSFVEVNVQEQVNDIMIDIRGVRRIFERGMRIVGASKAANSELRRGPRAQPPDFFC